MNKFRKHKFIIISAFLAVLMFTLLPQNAFAAWNSSYIVSDAHFMNEKSMTEAQIQSFLVAKDSHLLDYTVPAGRYKMYKGVSYYESPWIGPIGSEVNATGWKASKVIYQVSQWYSINPQTLIATIQKESSLIKMNPADWFYGLDQWAMGYAYTDSGIKNACHTDTNKNPTGSCAGFAMQVDWGGGALSHFWNHDASTNFPVGSTKKICFTYGSSICANTYIGNKATSSLYTYTPYFHGNQNYAGIIANWFPDISPAKISLTRFRVSMEDATTPLDDTDYILASNPAVGEPITIMATLKNSNIYEVTLKNIRILGTLASGTKFTVATISSLKLPAGATVSVPAQTFKITSLYTHTFSIDYQINNLRYSPHVDSDYSYQRITAHYPNVKVVKTPVITPISPKVNSAVAVTYKLKNYDARPAYLKAISFIARYGGKTPYYFPKISQKIMPSAIYQYTNSATFSIPGYYYGAAQITYGNDTTVIPSALSSCKNTANFRIYPI